MSNQNATPEDAVHLGDTNRASWNFSLHQVRANMNHLEDDAKEVMVSAFMWCTDPQHQVNRDEFSRRVGYDPSTIYRIFAGKYRNAQGELQPCPPKLIRAVRDFLALERERFNGGKKEFVVTPTARRIFTHCELARESQSPVFIWGPSHSGKTEALIHHQQANNHGRTVYCRVPASQGLGGMVRSLATALSISEKSSTSNLVKYIINGLTPDMLVMIDEVHELSFTYRKTSFFACLEVLREIYDRARCGMVLCGTRLLIEQLKGAQHAELEQLMRRGVHRLNLMSSPTTADVAAILKHHGLDFPERKAAVTVKGITEMPYECLRKLALADGLKSITERLRYARKLAHKRGEKLSWETFTEAHLTIEASAAQDDTKGGWQ